MKKKKEKPQSTKNLDEGAKQMLFKNYIREMEEKTEEYKSLDKPNINFHLLQSIRNKDKFRNSIFGLTYFYDSNFTGNKDFMHIPSISNILTNTLNYPIMLATQKDEFGNDEILGTTTVKMENNKSILDNPYFPTENEDILSITGILTKSDAIDKNGNKIKGLGKELFKSAIRSAYNINVNKKVRLIAEVDCRNCNSFYSISRAVKELKEDGLDIQIFLSGYYEIYNSNKTLKEAPTFILEVDLNNNVKLNKNNLIFDYTKCRFNFNLYSDLSKVIKANTEESKRFLNIVNGKRVIYHSIKPISTFGITLDVGETASGNARVPELKAIQLEHV